MRSNETGPLADRQRRLIRMINGDVGRGRFGAFFEDGRADATDRPHAGSMTDEGAKGSVVRALLSRS